VHRDRPGLAGESVEDLGVVLQFGICDLDHLGLHGVEDGVLAGMHREAEVVLGGERRDALERRREARAPIEPDVRVGDEG